MKRNYDECVTKYSDSFVRVVLDPNLRARGTKTGFYGFEQLVPIKSLNDLSTYKK